MDFFKELKIRKFTFFKKKCDILTKTCFGIANVFFE